MEGKRTTALCCLLIVLMSVPLQQVAAMSKFCRCYESCYPDCRKHLPRWLCVLKCMDDCSPNAALVVAPTYTVDCASICLRPRPVCGVSEMKGTDPADAASCVVECTKDHGAHAQPTANLN